MQNMFKTMNFNEPVQNKPSEEGSFVPNPAEFNTMQSLFKTQNLNMMPEMQNLDALNDIGNINVADFNTMQSLFKTNAHTIDKHEEPVNENNLL